MNENKVSTKKEGNSGLGIAGFVVGIVSIIFSFLPIINNLAFFMGIIAAIFGLIGIFTHQKKGLSIAGVILGILAIGCTLMMQAAWSAALDEATESANKELNNMTGENTEEILKNSVSVELGEFAMEKDEYGYVESSLPVTITNKESEAKTYSIHLEAVDESNIRIKDDTIYITDLGPNQTQTVEAFTYVSKDEYEAMQNITFNIVEVSMY